MEKTIHLVTKASKEAFDDSLFEETVKRKSGMNRPEVQVRALKRSIDARSKNGKVNIQALVSDC